METREIIDPQDWTTIWQSELSALAVDRESHEAFTTLAQLWSRGAGDQRATGHDGSAGRPGPDAPPGAAAVGAAFGPGDEVGWLRRRIAELERAAHAKGGR